MASSIHILNFFSSDILSLLQLEDILTSVNNFNCIRYWNYHTYITCFKPSIRCDCLICFLFIFVISHKYRWSSHPYLTSWTKSTILILVFTRIVHLVNVIQFEFHGAHNSTNMASQRIFTVVNKCSSCVFSLTISLVKWAAHYDLHELEDIFFNGSTTCNHKPNSSSEFLFDL